jgi:hypothetical protein
MQAAKPITRSGLFFLLASSAIFADPVLTIQPSQLIVNPGTNFSLDVDIQGAVDVYAFQFNLNVSTSPLFNPFPATEGSFLPGGGTTIFLPGRAGNAELTAVADTLVGAIPGVSGDGTLATVNFSTQFVPPEFRPNGTATVSLSNVVLLNSHLTPIPTTTVPAVVAVIPEPGTRSLAGLALIGLAWACQRRRLAQAWIAVFALLMLGRSAQAAAPGHTFTILAQTGDTIGGKTLTLLGDPIVNNAGTVVFPGLFDGGSGIFTPSSLLVQTGDTISGETVTNIVDRFGRAQIAVNNFDTVAFVGDFAGGRGIFTASMLLLKTGDVIDGKTLLSISDLPPGRIGINDAGTVAFEATFTPFEYYHSNQAEGIFTNVALISREFLEPDGLRNPQINNTGVVIFAGVNAASEDFISTQFGVVGGDDYADYPVINNAGNIAYACASPTDSNICTTSGRWGTGTTISGKKLTGVPGFAQPALNDGGTLVFNALFQSDPRFGPDESGIVTPSELIISSKDTIAGKPLTYYVEAFGPPVINNSGTIVFRASFADGTSGIVMATPISTGVAGDVNNDGVIDCTDVAFMRAIFGIAYGQAGFDPRVDLNGDGVIDVLDLAFLAQHLPDGTSCP